MSSRCFRIKKVKIDMKIFNLQNLEKLETKFGYILRQISQNLSDLEKLSKRVNFWQN